MESNQDGLKALLQEKDCVGVPANEEYQEYLVDYLLDENFFENELADYCVFPIGYNQSIVYIKSKNPLTGDDRRFRYGFRRIRRNGNSESQAISSAWLQGKWDFDRDY